MFSIAVPGDVFAPAYVWKGSLEHKAAKQPVTLTITNFNATSGRVNVTLTNRNAELLLSGEKLITHCYLQLHCNNNRLWRSRSEFPRKFPSVASL